MGMMFLSIGVLALLTSLIMGAHGPPRGMGFWKFMNIVRTLECVSVAFMGLGAVIALFEMGVLEF